MLLLLLIIVYAMPQSLKGKDPREMMSSMLRIIMGFAFLGGLVIVIGLVVWVKGTGKRSKAATAPNLPRWPGCHVEPRLRTLVFAAVAVRLPASATLNGT